MTTASQQEHQEKPATAKRLPSQLQDDFLSQLMTEQTPLSIYLVNGIRLQGNIVAMDKFTLLISNSRGSSAPQLVYKAAVSTIAPEIAAGR